MSAAAAATTTTIKMDLEQANSNYMMEMAGLIEFRIGIAGPVIQNASIRPYSEIC